MFVDKAEITVKAGDGGNGAVAFRREPYVPAGGPSGGDGGNGGNIVIVADIGLRTLMDFKMQKSYFAEKGEDGKGSKMFGKSGKDLILKVPVGTMVYDSDTGELLFDLDEDKAEFVVAQGGRGGKGNTHFKTATRQAPSFAKAGMPGKKRNIILELKMLADVGLIGFPNVGKSTFLSVITKANPKIANYHFTTLFPNLGVCVPKSGESFVVADIPGLIEGAGEGAGLGHDFLRHIERTGMLLHFVDISSVEGRDPYQDFVTVNNELTTYNIELSQKKQIVICNKIDLLPDMKPYNDFKSKLNNLGYEVMPFSCVTKTGIYDIINKISEYLSKHPRHELFDQIKPVKTVKIAENKPLFEIEKVNGVYEVSGDSVKRIMYSINFDDMESVAYFQKIMDKKGIIDALKEKGLKEGDTVRIYDYEFEYFK